MTWLTQLIPGSAPDGAPILSVLAKRTYKFAHGKPAWIDEDEQMPFIEADEYWGAGNPTTDAVKLESDLVAYKPMTDVVLIGLAHSPKGRKAYHLDVGIQVGTARKVFKVFGDRRVYVTPSGLAFSEPAPFERMPLTYALAYGGKDDKSVDGTAFTYPKNPVGTGFVVKANPKAVQDLILPNLEDPQKLLTPANLVLGDYEKWPLYPEPQGLGFTGKNFFPRYTMAGLPPDAATGAEFERQRAIQQMPAVGSGTSNEPPPPAPILNPQFFNGASMGLSFPYLSGKESLVLAHLDPDFPQFNLQLACDRPILFMDVGDGAVEMKTVLQTALIFKETNQLCVTWRGSVYYAGPEALRTLPKLEYGVRYG